MKKHLLNFLLIAFAFTSTAQKTSIDFTKYYSFGSNTSSNDFLKTSDNSYLFVGSDFGNGGDGDYSITKVDSLGDTLWHRRGHLYNTLCCVSWANAVKETSEGNFIVCAVYHPSTVNEVYLIMYNPQGDLLWEKTYSLPTRNLTVQSIIELNGTFLISGFNYANTNSNFLLKISETGDSLWGNYNLNFSIAGYPNSFVKVGENKIFAIHSTFDSSLVQYNPTIHIIDTAGNLLNSIQIIDSISLLAQRIQILSDGNYILTTRVEADTKERLYKIDSIGNIFWSTTIDFQNTNVQIKETSNKHFIIAGGFQVGKLDSLGNFIWIDTLSFPANFCSTAGLIITDSYKIVINGSISNGGGGDPTIPFLIRLNDNTLNGIGDLDSEKKFLKIFPNPAQQGRNIFIEFPQYDLNTSELMYNFYDALGKDLTTQISITNFKTTLLIRSELLKEGTYFIRITIDDQTYSNKIIIY